MVSIGGILSTTLAFVALPVSFILLIAGFFILWDTRARAVSSGVDSTNTSILRHQLSDAYSATCIPGAHLVGLDAASGDDIRWTLPLLGPSSLGVIGLLVWAFNLALSQPGHGLVLGENFAGGGLFAAYLLSLVLLPVLAAPRMALRGRSDAIVILGVAICLLAFISMVVDLRWLADEKTYSTVFNLGVLSKAFAMGIARIPFAFLSKLAQERPLSGAVQGFFTIVAAQVGLACLCGLIIDGIERLRFPNMARRGLHLKWMAVGGIASGLACASAVTPVAIAGSLLGLGLHAWGTSAPFRFHPGVKILRDRSLYLLAAALGAWALLSAATTGTRPWGRLLFTYVP